MARTLYTETVLILTANQYRMENGNQGTSLQYVSADYAETPTRRGSEPKDASASYGLFEELPVLPGVYRVSFGRGNNVRNQSGKSKATIEPVGAEYVEPVDLDLLLEAEPVKS